MMRAGAANRGLLPHERTEAHDAVAWMQSLGWSQSKMLRCTRENPDIDRRWEREYFKETGLTLAAHKVKAEMRRLLLH
jgi:hypothetical protein